MITINPIGKNYMKYTIKSVDMLGRLAKLSLIDVLMQSMGIYYFECNSALQVCW